MGHIEYCHTCCSEVNLADRNTCRSVECPFDERGDFRFVDVKDVKGHALEYAEELKRGVREAISWKEVGLVVEVERLKEFEAQCVVSAQAITKFQEERRELIAALKDAEFVLEGSCAIPGQTDAELTAREDALMRFFESKHTYNGK